jgi:hypothetical protein
MLILFGPANLIVNKMLNLFMHMRKVGLYMSSNDVTLRYI